MRDRDVSAAGLPARDTRSEAKAEATPSQPTPGGVAPALADEARRVPLEREGQYTRFEEVGRGGQSVVRRAVDEFVGREVALKELSSPPLADPTRTPAWGRFLREARLTAQLEHPGIVPVYELARRDDGTVFSSQKLIRGETLTARFARCRTLRDRSSCLPHLIAACQAVAYAHSRGVIHRDLKPSNIMIGAFGETVVVDWGLAKKRGQVDEEGSGAQAADPELSLAGAALGTPAYMSPEQARGDLAAIDARSDVFSLGAVLYQLLTGRPPFEGATPEQILENVRAGRFAPALAVAADAPPELAAIAERALRANPAERYNDAATLAQELSTYAAGGRVRAYDYGAWELLRKFAASHRALLTGSAIAIVALLVAGGVVAVRLHLTRVDLASSFLDRGYRAQREGDWSQAAAYFAAARVQHDTHEERWALAVARERIADRILSLQGPPESFTDVTVLPDGRVIALGHSLDRVEVREAESGKSLWQRSGEPILAAAFIGDGKVALSLAGGWSFHDAETGRELSVWPQASGSPCPGRYPPVAAVREGKLLRFDEQGSPHVVATDAAPNGVCLVSQDGRRAVYYDFSQGLRLVSLDDGQEIARRKNDFFWTFRFSPSHGLVVFRQGRLDVMGGPEGDFTIDLPDAAYGGRPRPFELFLFGGAAVSQDGRLVAFASRLGTTQALVVDLQSRSIRGVLHYAPGWPRLTFSPDGQRVFAAGMGNATLLSGWRLPPEDLPKTPRWWSSSDLSQTGGTAMTWDFKSGRYEFYRPPTKLVASGTLRWKDHAMTGDGPIGAFIETDMSAVFLHDLEADRRVWSHPCRRCLDLSVSLDASMFAFFGADGLEVWDTRRDKQLFQETRRFRPFASQSAVSRDGRRVAWNYLDTAVVRDLDSGRERMLPLDGALRHVQFSPDPERLLTVTTRTISLWNTAAGRAIWSRPNDVPGNLVSRWSPERGALLLQPGFMGTELLDAETGERLAWFGTLSRVVTPVSVEIYFNDLRTKMVASTTHSEFRPVAQPDEEAAAQSLARTLQRTGLVLRGVELVAAP